MTRRDFLKLSLALSVSDLFAGDEEKLFFQNKTIWLVRGKNEIISNYVVDGKIILDEFKRLCKFYKDEYANEAVIMDVALFHITANTQAWLRARGILEPLELLSGYRTPNYNRQIEGAARNSLHLDGKAGDYRHPQLSPYGLGLLLRKMGGGGIGIYNKHTHCDTWHKRSWFVSN